MAKRSLSGNRGSVAQRLLRRCILGAAAVAALAQQNQAADNSPAPILQFFEGSYRTIERRTADIFMAGYGTVWTPPPGRSDQGNFSVGYDVYDRFDLGSGGNPTMYGTETGIKTMSNTLHRAGMDLHVDFVLNHNGYSGTGDAGSRAAFKQAGGYPGFFLDFFNDPDGDFNSGYAYGDVQGRLAGLIDIDHSKNYLAVRNPIPNPIGPNGQPLNNIAAGTVPWNGRLANVATEENRRFYPDRNGSYISVFDPKTGTSDIRVYSFNTSNPMSGDPVEENALGYIMRNAQWLVQVVGVDGLRIDAAKHVDGYVLDYIDRSVYRQNPRNLLDGSPKNVFSYSEVFDGNTAVQLSHIRKDINPNDIGKIGGNRDTLDFKFHFALKDKLENTGSSGTWQALKDNDLDLIDDGKRNGSAGVKFVHNHDVYKPYALDDVAHAYTLMLPGNATVYFNAKEFGDNRDFPKPGRGDALSVKDGSTLTKILKARTTHGRGDYRERWIEDNEGLFAYERLSSAVVGLSNRGDRGFDQRTIEVGFAPGTHLMELSGNHAGWADPYNDISEVLTVRQVWDQNENRNKNVIDLRIPRNTNANGDFHGKGFVIYGLPTPQSSGLQLSNVDSVLAGDSTPVNNYENGTQRQTDVKVIKSNSFRVRLMTNEVRLLGQDSLRDIYADGDFAAIKIDGGVDINGNGRVDMVAPGTTTYGFENFTTKNSPLIGRFGLQAPHGDINAPRGDGEFLQDIDTTKLSEGYHFITVNAYRLRTDGGPDVFSEFKDVIYVDRLKPVSAVNGNKPVTDWAGTHNEKRDFFFKSTDQTADSMHVFMDLPANMTESQILGMVGAGNRADYWDRDVFKKYFDGITNGNHVFTVVTYEQTGTYNVQRFAGNYLESIIGRGLGDLNTNGSFGSEDITGSNSFKQIYESRNAQFHAAADLNGDGLVDGKDLLQLRSVLRTGGADNNTMNALTQVLRNRADLSGDFGPNWYDINLQRSIILGEQSSADLWVNDFNSDGVLDGNDLTAMITGLFETRMGDLNLDGTVGVDDLRQLVANYNKTGGWTEGNVTLDGAVSLTDLNTLLLNYQGPTYINIGHYDQLDASALSLLSSFNIAAVPEPTGIAVVGLSALSMLRRPNRKTRSKK